MMKPKTTQLPIQTRCFLAAASSSALVVTVLRDAVAVGRAGTVGALEVEAEVVVEFRRPSFAGAATTGVGFSSTVGSCAGRLAVASLVFCCSIFGAGPATAVLALLVSGAVSLSFTGSFVELCVGSATAGAADAAEGAVGCFLAELVGLAAFFEFLPVMVAGGAGSFSFWISDPEADGEAAATEGVGAGAGRVVDVVADDVGWFFAFFPLPLALD